MRTSRLNLLVIVLFALSGATGLVYEIAWSKYLSLFIGNTTYSHMIVLATFMGGIALGSWYWGKYADRTENPLKLYGILELLIGVYCFAYPVIVQFSETMFTGIAGGLEISSGSAGLLLLKFFLSFSTLLFPTFLMGGTLPILTKFFVRDISDTGTRVAKLYFTNSLGAVVGTVAAGFFLIRYLSLDTTVWIAAGVNMLIGAVVVAFSGALPKSNASAAPAPESREKDGFSRRFRDIAIAAAAVGGFTAMIYELTWIRLLANILGSSTYSFSLMLTAFISGIALGSLVISSIMRRTKSIVAILGFCQIGTAAIMLAVLPVYERLPYYMVRIAGIIANKPENFPVFLFLEFLFCFGIMIVPTTLSGMSLPIASQIAGTDIRILGRSIGGIFSINTLGTVIGALVAGLLLIPLLGVQRSIEAAILVSSLLGFAIIAIGTSYGRSSKIALGLLLLIAGTGYSVAFPSWNVFASTSGVFRTFSHEPPQSFDEFLTPFSARKILWYKEGVNANVAVLEIPGERDSLQRALLINGKTDATTDDDLATQVLLAQIPLVALPDSGNALVIGLGSGITAASALTHPLRSVDCVEISSEVVECNSFFAKANNNVLADPRLHLHNEDGITFLKLTKDRFDFIISEPSNPWISGIGNLFSAEFFELCKNRLTARGVLTQWFHTYEINDEALGLVLNTLSSVFPYVMIWAPADGDLIFLASAHPIAPQFDEMKRRMANESVAADLRRIDIDDVPAFLSTQSTSFLSQSLYAKSADVNTEKRPLLEFMAPVSLFAPSAVALPTTLDDRFSPRLNDLWFVQYERTHPLTVRDFLAIARFQARPPTDYKMAYSAYAKVLRLDPKNIDALGGMARVTDVLKLPDERRSALQLLSVLYPNDPTVLSQLANEQFRQEDQTASVVNIPAMTDPVRLFSRCVDLTEKNDERFVLTLAMTLTRAGRYMEAVAAYNLVREIRKEFEPSVTDISDADLLCSIAENYYYAEKLSDAEETLGRIGGTAEGNEKMLMLKEKIMLRKKGAL